MTFEKAREIFLNRGYEQVDGGSIYNPDKWRDSVIVISDWLQQAPIDAVSRADAIEVVDHMLMGERNHKIVALEELKQLPSVQPKPTECEDAVNRTQVKERMMKYGFLAPDMTVTEFVEDLPPVQPKQKVGEWIEDDSDDFFYKCSECGKRPGFIKYGKPYYNYCPYCGIRLINKE